MSLYDEVKSNITRQDLQLVEAGQHYKVYSAKVKYTPENVERADFFKLCYGMLTKCDEINLYTYKKDAYEVVYKFIVTDVDIENKVVAVKQLSKIDFNAKTKKQSTSKTEPLFTLEDVQELIDKAIKDIATVVADIDTKVEELKSTTEKYQSDTDDQLEEIEIKLEELINGEETNSEKTE